MMAPNSVTISILAASCGIICQCAPVSKTVAGFDSQFENQVVKHVLSNSPLGRMGGDYHQVTSRVGADLVPCYNGVFSNLTAKCDPREGCDITQEPLYKLCDENRDELLNSYWLNAGELTGASMFIPVEYLSFFNTVVNTLRLKDASMEEKLKKFGSGIWFWSDGTKLLFGDYCERMVDQMDEFAQWGYDAEQVVDYFETKTKLRVGEALELCRTKLAL